MDRIQTESDRWHTFRSYMRVLNYGRDGTVQTLQGRATLYKRLMEASPLDPADRDLDPWEEKQLALIQLLTDQL
jgi:hypothetical protein